MGSESSDDEPNGIHYLLHLPLFLGSKCHFSQSSLVVFLLAFNNDLIQKIGNSLCELIEIVPLL